MIKDDCIFCKLANGIFPTNTIYEDEDFRVILDNSPAAKGHSLIIPKQHFENIYSTDDAYLAKLLPVAKKVANALKKTFNCDGVNIVQNNEPAAGQSGLDAGVTGSYYAYLCINMVFHIFPLRILPNIFVLLSHAEFGENFFHQIVFHSFSQNSAEHAVSVHEVDGEEVLTHSVLDAVLYKTNGIKSFFHRILMSEITNEDFIFLSDLTGVEETGYKLSEFLHSFTGLKRTVENSRTLCPFGCEQGSDVLFLHFTGKVCLVHKKDAFLAFLHLTHDPGRDLLIF